MDAGQSQEARKLAGDYWRPRGETVAVAQIRSPLWGQGPAGAGEEFQPFRKGTESSLHHLFTKGTSVHCRTSNEQNIQQS